jgi:hypothetical protein
MRERAWIVVAVLFAAAIVLGARSLGAGIRGRGAVRNDMIAVTGSAKKLIQSDYVIWDASFSSQQATPAAAAKELAGWTTTVTGFLHDHGVEGLELSLEPVTAETVHKGAYGGGKIIGYRLTDNIEVRSTRVTQVTAVASESSQLLALGIPFESQPLQYIYTKLASVRLALLAAATKDALDRAGVLVDATGAHLGTLRKVDVGVFQITPPNSTDVSDYGEYDTSTIQKDVTAVVNVSFALS